MIKILFFIPGLSEGGAEKVLRNLVNNMDQSKFDITVQTIDKCDSDRYLTQGIHYKSINHCKTKIGKKLFSYFFRLCAELKIAYSVFVKDDYDIEVAYLETIATKIMAQSTNKKALKLAWVHCDLQEKGMSSEKTRNQYKNFHKVVCVSEDTKRAFDACFGYSVESKVLYNVIDEDEIFEKAEEHIPIVWNTKVKNLLAIGRLTQQKSFDYLIKTCAKLKDNGYQFYLRILGEGPERYALTRLITELKLDNYVELCGFIDNPYPYIKMSDYVVCSSKYEGLSTVVLEAMILGKTVITTPCTGMIELLGNSEYGLIVEDNIDGLYNGLCLLMNSGRLQTKYSHMSMLRGEFFSKKKQILKIEKFLIEELRSIV